MKIYVNFHLVLGLFNVTVLTIFRLTLISMLTIFSGIAIFLVYI